MAVGVHEELDPFPGEIPAAAAVPLHVLLPAASPGLGEQTFELLDPVEHRRPVRPVLLGGAIDPAGKDLHHGQGTECVGEPSPRSRSRSAARRRVTRTRSGGYSSSR